MVRSSGQSLNLEPGVGAEDSQESGQGSESLLVGGAQKQRSGKRQEGRNQDSGGRAGSNVAASQGFT